MKRTILAVAVTASLLTSGAGSLWDLLSSIDAGCGWDPNGQCQPAPRIDAGCIWDPYGQCRPAPQTDAGCGWDPDGCPQGS